MDLKYETGRIYMTDDHGAVVAEVTFPAVSADVVNIDHTFVHDSLRGQGVAAQLMKAAADRLRGEGRRAYPTCSYAVRWFEKNPDYADVYTESPEL